jgi:hypothetical protein
MSTFNLEVQFSARIPTMRVHVLNEGCFSMVLHEREKTDEARENNHYLLIWQPTSPSKPDLGVLGFKENMCQC